MVSSLSFSKMTVSMGSLKCSETTAFFLPKLVYQIAFMYFLINETLRSEYRNYGLKIAAPN